ncbi:hypothetical protein PMAYCL1PPCAC_00054, partial [Pristionchus mayeri]
AITSALNVVNFDDNDISGCGRAAQLEHPLKKALMASSKSGMNPLSGCTGFVWMFDRMLLVEYSSLCVGNSTMLRTLTMEKPQRIIV